MRQKKTASPFPDPVIKGLDVSVAEFGWSSDELGAPGYECCIKNGDEIVPILYEGYVCYVISHDISGSCHKPISITH